MSFHFLALPRWVAVLLAALALVLVAAVLPVVVVLHRDTPRRTVARNALPTPVIVVPATAAGIDVIDGNDGTQLRQIGYDGHSTATAWTLRPAQNGLHVVSISPDGQYVVALDNRQNWQVVDARNRVLGTVPDTIDREALGVWSPDSAHLCGLSLGDSTYPWRVVEQDVSDLSGAATYIPIFGMPAATYGTLAACDVQAARAVVVAPVSGDRNLPREAITFDLATGRIVARVPLGDSSHGTIFSLDGRYLALVDYASASSSIVNLVTGGREKVELAEVRGFSGDDSLVVENTMFEGQPGIGPGLTRVVDWRTGSVHFSRDGWTNGVRTRAGAQDMALGVLHQLPGDPNAAAGDLVIVPGSGPAMMLAGRTIY